MIQITLVWAAFGIGVGLIAAVAGAGAAFPVQGTSGDWWRRQGLALGVVMLAAIAGGWLATFLVGRLAASAVSITCASLAALTLSMWRYLAVRYQGPHTDIAPDPQ